MYKDFDEDFPQKKNISSNIIKVKNIIDDIFGSEGLVGTKFTTKSDFLSLFTSLYKLNEEYNIPKKNMIKVLKILTKFSADVHKLVLVENTNGKKLSDATRQYASSVANRHTTSQKERDIKDTAIRQTLLPYLISIDKKRVANDDERLYIWNTKSHKCDKCKKVVKSYNDYDCDHIKKYSNGGKTILSNFRVRHSSCNRRDNRKN
jgi:hypothetical protein